MMPLDLERFDDPDEQTESRFSPEYLRGFDAGQADLETKLKSQQTDALEKISQSLSDMTFGFEEARQYLLSHLSPIMTQVASLIVPAVLHETFKLHLEEALQGYILQGTDAPVVVKVSRNTRETLTTSEISLPSQFEFVCDETLTDGQAVIGSHDSGIVVDLDALLKAIHAALCTLDTFEGVKTNE